MKWLGWRVWAMEVERASSCEHIVELTETCVAHSVLRQDFDAKEPYMLCLWCEGVQLPRRRPSNNKEFRPFAIEPRVMCVFVR